MELCTVFQSKCKFKKATNIKTLEITVLEPERESGQSKEMPLVIYLAFLAKMANLYYIILTAFRKYWPDTVAKFMSGTQETFI